MKPIIAGDKQREARRVAATFQTKVVKYLESTLASPNGVNQIRIKLGIYTASRAVCGDLVSMCACCASAKPWRSSAMRSRSPSKNSMTRGSPE